MVSSHAKTKKETGLKLIFAGTPEFAVPCLQALIDSQHDVIAVYTQPDRPAGRGRQLTASPVKKLAEQNDIAVEQPQSLRQEAAQKTLAAYQADAIIVVAYGLILPQEILATPKLGCINVHASLLPELRGAAPIQRAILAGYQETGVTIMQMDAGLDTGDMLLKVTCNISSQETGQSLHDKLAGLGAEALLTVLANPFQPEPQNHEQSSYATKLSKQEGLIDWQQPAIDIDRKIRAFNPWPVAYTQLHQDTLRLWQAEVIEQATDKMPGTILQANQSGIDVATGEGVIRLLKLQMSGGKILPVADILNAHHHLFLPDETVLG